MMNMIMMMIIIIRMITMSYQGWIQLENFNEIQGFLSISVLLIFAIRFFQLCHVLRFSAFLGYSSQKCIRLSPRALMPQNSNYSIMQC